MGTRDAAYWLGTSHSGLGMRREQMSQSYTTRLDQLWVVKAK
ncbi:hypothetical protein DND90_33155 [Pseudomonas syringae pv. maculicola]|nr:hypothetical protein DND90_33155 [Pseudomonas syringae pv. maculicola]